MPTAILSLRIFFLLDALTLLIGENRPTLQQSTKQYHRDTSHGSTTRTRNLVEYHSLLPRTLSSGPPHLISKPMSAMLSETVLCDYRAQAISASHYGFQPPLSTVAVDPPYGKLRSMKST